MIATNSHIRRLADEVQATYDRGSYFSRNSRSFSLAARLFPADMARDVAAVYGFCRFTDDLVDARPLEPTRDLARELDEWLSMARRSYDGDETGIALLDEPMRRMGDGKIPFTYVRELVTGVRSDLDPVRFRDFEELGLYTYRVAGVVGCWLTELFGRREPDVLRRAAALGDAMQITNILRDVGEDLDAGRVYLPVEVLDRFGLELRNLRAWRSGRTQVDERYRALIEHVMAAADERYRFALGGVPALPRYAQRPVVVAARIYQGIHDRIRANGYDNLTRRAVVPFWRKGRYAARALADLPRVRRHSPFGVPD